MDDNISRLASWVNRVSESRRSVPALRKSQILYWLIMSQQELYHSYLEDQT